MTVRQAAALVAAYALLPATLTIVSARQPIAPAKSAVELQARVDADIRAFAGVMGVAAIDLANGETIAVNADTRFPTASLIKVPVMVEVFHQIAAGKLRRDTTVTLRDRDKAGDEPVVLNQLRAGLVVSVGDLLALMTAFSDNTATNLLIGLVGTANVDKRIDVVRAEGHEALPTHLPRRPPRRLP